MSSPSACSKSPWATVPLKLISELNFVPVDLYVRLSEVKYIKVYRKDDTSLNETVQSYKKKNVEYFFCRRLEYDLFTTFCSHQNVKINDVERVELIQQMIALLGVTEVAREQINSAVDQTLSILRESREISSYLKAMLEKGDYLSQHSTMVSFVSCMLAREMDWHSRHVLEKLSFASILHDMTLTAEILLKLKSSEGDISPLTWKEQKKYKNHIDDVVSLIERAKNIPPDVADIVGDHHEYSLNGFFPNKKSASSIAQITALFILADQFCHLVHFEDDVKVEHFLEEWETFYEHFNRGNFKKPLKCLDNIVKRNML